MRFRFVQCFFQHINDIHQIVRICLKDDFFFIVSLGWWLCCRSSIILINGMLVFIGYFRIQMQFNGNYWNGL